MSDIQKIISLFKSRNTIIQLLSSLEYDVQDYESFSINEIDAMSKNDQLDMLMTHTKNAAQKIYVKYHLPEKQKQISRTILDDTIEDLFRTDNVLSRDDILIIIMDDEPNDSNIARMNYLFDHEGYFVVMHNIKRLQFNITKHSMVPKMTILNEEEKNALMKEKNINRLNQFPEISRYDPHALALCVRPNQVCKIERDSATALNCIYYRVCV